MKPLAGSLANNRSSFRQSLAFDKSVRIEPTNPPLFKEVCHEAKNQNEACCVLCAFLNAHKISLKKGSK